MDLRTQRGAPRLIASLALLLLTLSDLVGSTQTQCLWDPLESVRPRRCLAPVDDETGLADDLPWTHEPHCIFHGAADQKTEKYCVYTTTAFNENSGLSLITTPDIAASLVGGIENHTAAWSARYHLQVSGRPPPPTAKLAYRIADIPGKGKGVVATRMIHQYESIMVSYPTVIADNAFFPRDPSQAPEQGPFLCQRAAAQLVDRKRLLSLARSGERGLSLVEDIVRTNAFGLSINGRDHKGLYPEIARFNHGCAPNAFARFTTRDLALEAIATKDIEAGEEILLSYIPMGMASAHRARGLANWGFQCSCALCTSPPEVLAESDRARGHLLELYHRMVKDDTDYAELVELTREFVGIVKQEELVPKVGEYYQLFMEIYYSYGDLESALRYGQLALFFAETFSDPDGTWAAGLRLDLAALKRGLDEG